MIRELINPSIEADATAVDKYSIVRVPRRLRATNILTPTIMIRPTSQATLLGTTPPEVALRGST